MRAIRLLPCLILLASPAAAAPDWRQAREYDVLLSSFDIQPQTMTFKAGQPLRLRLINNSPETHSFSAKGFFAAGEVRTRERKAVGDGTVQVGPGDTREILIVPAAGRYSARCSNLFHRVMGMSSKIVVE
jgi:FtsP/CotA-like multicopper oxidase with cupredoxin domain